MFTIEWKLLLSRLLLTCLIVSVAGIAMRTKPNPTLPPTTTTTTTIEFIYTKENLNQMIEKIADEEDFENVYLLKRLAEIESQYLTYPEIVENNGWYSRGVLHYRTSTFLEQGIKYGVIPKDTTIEEALVLTYNPELQIRIACRMGNENIRLIRQHWVNSYNKIYCD